MSEKPEFTDCLSCSMHDAVLKFAAARYEMLARRVIFRMQRMEAIGLYDDYRHKTLWDEYCHEVQEGPDYLLESAWHATIDGFVDSVVERFPTMKQHC
jgi:hypothetical protein